MKKQKSGFARRLILALIVFAVLLLGVYLLVNKVGSASGQAETELVRDAVRSAVLTCYAVEGAYPTNINYLKEYYGLAYNEEAYKVLYDSFASNVMPSVTVIERGGDGR